MKLPAIAAQQRRARLAEKATAGQLSPELAEAVRKGGKVELSTAIARSGASPAELRMAARWLEKKGAGWKIGVASMAVLPSIERVVSGARVVGGPLALLLGTSATAIVAANSVVNRVQARKLKSAMLDAANALEVSTRAGG